MKDAAVTNGGSTFPVRCSVGVVDPFPSSTTTSSEAEKLLRPYVGGERGGKLRSQLARLHRDTPMEKIEEAIQTACDRFVDKGEGISAPGQVYAWVRTTAHRILSREEDQHLRELPTDPSHERLQEVVAEEPGPAEEAIAHEEEAELVALVREVSDSLPERKREILALYGADYKRPEIASRLGLTERAVKRDLLEIMDEARAAIAEKAGGGCLRGEPLVLRFAYGLASPAEAEQARLHMKGCHRCEALWERLDAWREKAAVLLPAPAIEQASPGLLGRLAHRTIDGLASVKQQVLGGASQAKQQVAAGASQVKQQAATTYYRAVDPTPLAGARPSAVAAVLISCVTIGGGAASYCAQNGFDPIDAAAGLIPGSEEQEPKEPTEAPTTESPEATAVVPPAPAPEVEQPVAESEPTPQPEEEPKPEPEPTPPPPEQSFEPASPNYPAVEAEADYQAPETSSSESARPAPVSGGGAPQFGGP
jgi:RNA polymerase sigma factor (sigma-70 family)